MQFSKIAMSVALFMSALVSGAAIYNEALEARCVKCHGDNSCQNGTPFPPECKKGCCQEY